jgi:hypothetical protein
LTKETVSLENSEVRETEKDKERDMVGSGVGGGDRSKDAVGMMALHEALRSVCFNSDWIYSVFWTIRPRPYTLLSLSFSLCSSIFLCFFTFFMFHFLISGGSVVVMAARLVMKVAACEFFLVSLYPSSAF